MARGQKEAADKQLATTNAIGADERSRANKLQSTLIPGYTSLMNTGYFSPAEEHAAVSSEMGSAEAPFEAAGFQARNRAGATRNAADLTAEEDQLALERGRTAGETAAGLQKEKMTGQLAGAAGLGNLNEEDMRAMEAMYGLGPGTLSARAGGRSGDEIAQGWFNSATGQG
jgi:hypothetical protein